MSGASFTLSLVDRATAPAGKISQAISRMVSALGKVQGSGQAAMSWMKMTRGADGRFQPLSRGAAAAKFALDKLKEAGTRALSAVGHAAMAAGRHAVALGKELGTGLVKEVGKSAVFLQRQQMAFEMLAGGPEKGKAAFQAARDLALKYGLDMQGTIDSYRKLLAMQFSPDMAKQLITMSADLQAIGVHGEEAQRVIVSLSQIKGKGRLQGEELLQLAEAGISTELVYKNLAKAMGKTVDEARKAVTAGKVTSEQGIEAIKQTVLQKTHTSKLGEAAEKVGRTGAGMWARLKGRGQLMIMGMAEKLLTRLGPQLEGAFGSIEQWMSGKEGRGFVDNIATGLGAVAQQLPQLIAPLGQVLSTIGQIAGSAEFGSLVSSVGGAVTAVVPLLGTLAGAFIKVANAIAGALSWVGSQISAFAQSIGGNATFFGGRTGKQGGAIAGADQIPGGQAVEAASGLKDKTGPAGEEAGAALGQGMVAGMNSQTGAVNAAAAALGEAAKAGADTALEVHSPSRVFARIGTQVAAGFAAGMGAAEPQVETASARMVLPRFSGLARGASNTFNTKLGGATINVSGAGDPQAVAAAVRQILADELAGAFEQVAIQVSGAA